MLHVTHLLDMYHIVSHVLVLSNIPKNMEVIEPTSKNA